MNPAGVPADLRSGARELAAAADQLDQIRSQVSRQVTGTDGLGWAGLEAQAIMARWDWLYLQVGLMSGGYRDAAAAANSLAYVVEIAQAEYEAVIAEVWESGLVMTEDDWVVVPESAAAGPDHARLEATCRLLQARTDDAVRAWCRAQAGARDEFGRVSSVAAEVSTAIHSGLDRLSNAVEVLKIPDKLRAAWLKQATRIAESLAKAEGAEAKQIEEDLATVVTRWQWARRVALSPVVHAVSKDPAIDGLERVPLVGIGFTALAVGVDTVSGEDPRRALVVDGLSSAAAFGVGLGVELGVDALAGGVLVTGGGLLLAVGAGVVVGYVAATAAAWTYDHWGEITHHPDQASREALKDGGNWFGQQAQGAGNLLHNLTG